MVCTRAFARQTIHVYCLSGFVTASATAQRRRTKKTAVSVCISFHCEKVNFEFCKQRMCFIVPHSRRKKWYLTVSENSDVCNLMCDTALLRPLARMHDVSTDHFSSLDYIFTRLLIVCASTIVCRSDLPFRPVRVSGPQPVYSAGGSL